MRTLAFWGLASTAALLPVGLAGSADSAQTRSTMTTGAAPRAQAAQGWGNVPDLGLNPPAAAPAPAPVPSRGGWGPGGWQGGDAPPPGVAPGGPALGEPAGPPPGMMVGPGGPADRRGRPDSWRGDSGRRDGDRRGRGGYGPDYGPRGAAWSGRYNRVGRGYVVPGYLRAPNFYVSNWWNYGLGRPAYGQNWIRYYDDALLIDGYGRVVDTRYGMEWDRFGPPDGYPDYGYGDGYEPGNYDRGFRDGEVEVYRSGPNAPGVTVHRGNGGSTVVVVQNPSTATTTTTYYDEPVGSGRKPRKPTKGRRR